MYIVLFLLLSLAPVLAFWPPVGSLDELLSRFALFGLIIAIEAAIGHTLSLPFLAEKKIGPTPADHWGKTVRWNASIATVIGLVCTVLLIPTLLS